MTHCSKPTARRLLTAALALAGVASPALADPPAFNPHFALGRIYENNLALVSNEVDPSDWITTISAAMPVQKDFEHGFFQLSYRVAHYAYDEFSELDNTEHALRLRGLHHINPKSSIRAYAYYVRTQDQANPRRTDEEEEDQVDPNPFVSRRAQEDTVGAAVAYRLRISQFWRWSASISARGSQFERLSDVDPDRLAVENRAGYRFRTSASRALTERTSMGLNYSFAQGALEESGDEQFQLLDFSIFHRWSESFGTDFRLGAFRRENTTTGEVDQGPTGFVDLRFNEGLVVGPFRFFFGATVTPSSGGSLVGTALRGSVSVTMSNLVAPVGPATPAMWRWAVYGRYSRRVPFDDTLDTTDTLTFGASAERRLTRRLGLRFSARWVEQTGTTSESDADFWRAAGFLTYYPLRGTRIAQR